MDQKYRWGGFLEVPIISKIQRNILDFGRNRRLKKFLEKYNFASVVDVGCGLGEISEIFSCSYTGLDNSFSRLSYSAKRYVSRNFLVVDAKNLPFFNNVYDAALMIDTSHHLSDDDFLDCLQEMSRVASRYLIISDPIHFSGQNVLSRFFYGLDRGGCFRTADYMKLVFGRVKDIELVDEGSFITFPGFYKHAVFVLRLTHKLE